MVEQQAADPAFKAAIINISSISATFVTTNRGECCVGKAGMSMATQLFAARLGEYHIPVSVVRPGIVATDMTANVTEKYDTLVADGLCGSPSWGLTQDVRQLGRAAG